MVPYWWIFKDCKRGGDWTLLIVSIVTYIMIYIKYTYNCTTFSCRSDGRTNTAHGLVHFIDTRCMVAGDRFDIKLLVKLVDPTGNSLSQFSMMKIC